MCTFYRMMVITAIMALSFTEAFCVLAAPAQQVEPPLEIEITTIQMKDIVGDPITWRVTLTPHGQQRINSIELRPGDARTWDWLDGVRSFKALTGTIALDVSAIPLVSGDLRPILEARYTVGEEVQTQLIVNDTFVHVEPIETCIEAGIIAKQGTVRKEDRLPVELWVRNRSPFTLTQVQAHGNGADLAWEDPTAPVDIPPGETFRQVLTSTVTGRHPQPQLSIEYAWVDATRAIHAQSMNISGKDLLFAKTTIEDPWRTIISMLAGSVISLIPALIQEYRSRKHQKETNRQHVHGLLRLMILQSKYAADNVAKIDLAPLETIFKEEGLFAIIKEDGLDQGVHNLWEKAERHNMGLSLHGGTQRIHELKESVGDLKIKLNQVTSGKSCRQNDG